MGREGGWGEQEYIGKIREDYQRDWGSKSMKTKQMAVALYFIDKLALRAGHEKDEDEADTVGCCTLKVSLPACLLPAFTFLFPLRQHLVLHPLAALLPAFAPPRAYSDT